MRLKAIPVWEQYLEKIVVGLLLVALLAVIVLEVISSPNESTVRVNGVSKTLAPGELNAELADYAGKIRIAQGDNAPPMATPPAPNEVQMISPLLDEMISGRVSPRRNLPGTSPMIAGSLVPSGERKGAIFYEPSLPRLDMLSTVQVFQDELTVAAMEEYSDALTGYVVEGSREIDWAIPVARIDMAATRAEFDGADANRDRIPSYWRDSTYAIVDIVFERTQRQPDGSWSDPTTVVPLLANADAFRDDLDVFEEELSALPEKDEDARNDLKLKLRDDLLDALSVPQLQTDVVHPRFYDTEYAAAAVFLEDPFGTDPTRNKDLDVLKLEDQYIKQRSKVERLRAELDQMGGPLDPPEQGAGNGNTGNGRGGRGGGGGRGGRGGGGGGSVDPPGGGTGGGGVSGGGGRTQGGENEGSAEKAADRERINKTRQLRTFERQLDKLFERLQAEAPNSDLVTGGAVRDDASLVDVVNDDVVLAWAHDPDIQVDATYRYRCVARFYNPFFTREFQLESPQQGLAVAPTMETMASDWSDPMTVTSGFTYFVTEAKPAAKGQMGSATIEVFRIDGGRPWSETYTLSPGDRLGREESIRGREGTLDFTTDWYLVDIVTSGSDVDGTKVTEVVLQRIGDPAARISRDPDADANSEERQILALEVSRASKGGGKTSMDQSGDSDGR